MSKLITLKNQIQFDLANRLGQKRQGRYFILITANKFVMPQHIEQDPDAIYYGLKVSKKFAKRAVDRNKTKRRIRHLLRQYFADYQGPIKAMVVIPRKNFTLAKFTELEQELAQLCANKRPGCIKQIKVQKQ